MKKSKSIIELVKVEKPVYHAHLAKVFGEKFYSKPSFYRNRETGGEYGHIAGGIAWPGKNSPGFAVIVGVDKTDDSEPPFRVLDEVEDHNVQHLLQECIRLREKYGYHECPDLLRFWYGDPERFMSFLSEANIKLQTDKRAKNGFYISSPIDFNQPNAFEIYARRVLSCLMPDKSGKKRLHIGSCNKLRNHLQNFSAQAVGKSVEDYPSIAASGYTIHSFIAQKPWRWHISRFGQTAHRDPFEVYEDFALKAAADSLRWQQGEDKPYEADTVGTIE